MKKRSILRWILYAIGSITALTAVGIWIFLSFYLEGTIDTVVIPKIQQAAFQATHGRFALTLGKISYSHGTLVCKTFTLSRVAYDSSEHGIGLERLTIDSARFEGIRWWDVLLGNDLKLSSLQLNSPKLSIIDIDSDMELPHHLHFNTSKKMTSAERLIVPVISFDSIVLRDISLSLRKLPQKAIEPSYRNITVKLTNFSLDVKRMLPELPLFSEHVDFELPGITYAVKDSMYSIEVHGIKGSIADSQITIDTVAYMPNYSEQEFADRNKYLRGRVEFLSTNVHVRGINFMKFLQEGVLDIRTCEAASWSVYYYGDRRKPRNPHPPDAILPNDIIDSIKIPVTIDSIILDKGLIKHQERDPGSVKPSLITLTDAHVIACPFCTDASSELYSQPMRVTATGLFMGQSKVVATMIYPIHHKTFDLQIDATAGPFGLSVLNSYLVTNERKEVEAGKFLSGELHMNVKSGAGTTTVSPRYTGLEMKILPDDSKQTGGLIEGIKSFFANTFVLRTDNVDDENIKAYSARTSYRRSRKEEFFQFIWFGMRKSIRQVVGY
jgi:hypothetical protein